VNHKRTFNGGKKLRWQALDPRGQRRQGVEGDVRLATLDSPHLTRVDTHAAGKLFDAKIEFLPAREADLAEGAEGVARSKRTARGGLGWSAGGCHAP
jgi:hypothetical protein